MPDVTVRTADPDDALAIIAVKQAAIDELAASAYTADQRAAWAPDDAAIEEFRDALSADTFQVLVAVDDDRVVGYGVLNAAEASIDALFVRPFWARLGIATRLLAQLEMSATFAGCESLSAVVSRNAVDFYEQAGYEQIESRTRTMDDVDVEFTYMEKALSNGSTP